MYVVFAIMLGIAVPRIDETFLRAYVTTMSVASEIAILSSIASGMMALTAIVFSMVLVMVQVGGSVFSPRLVQWLAHDRTLRHALGVFIGTFVFALLALTAIDRGNSGRVPVYTASTAFVWLLASIVLLILLIERVSRLYITNVLTAVGTRGRDVIAEIYARSGEGEPAPEKDARSADWAGTPATQNIYYHGAPQVVAAIDVARLVNLARQVNGVIEIDCAVGDFVADGSSLAHLHDARSTLEEPALYDAIMLGPERTMKQDPKYPIRLLVDIAIRGLSPAINDPTTAVQALNQIDDLLRRLGRSHLEIGRVADRDGVLRVVFPAPTWDDFLDLALLEIMFYGAGSVQVMRRMGALLDDLEETVAPSRKAAVTQFRAHLHKVIDRSFHDVDIRADAQATDRQGLGLTRHEDETG